MAALCAIIAALGIGLAMLAVLADRG